MSAILSGILLFLIQTAMDFFLDGAAFIGKTIVKIVTDAITKAGNPIANIISLLPLGEDIGFDFAGIIVSISIGLAFFCLIVSGLQILTCVAMGEKNENPLGIVLRFAVSVTAIVLLYGNLNGALTGGILTDIVSVLFYPMRMVASWVNSIDTTMVKVTLPSIGDGFYSFIGVLIISGGILAGVLSGALSIVERCITIVLHILLGPIFLALMACKDTAGSAVEWFKGLIVQSLTLLVSLFMWGLALTQLVRFNSSYAGSWQHVGQVWDGTHFIEAIGLGAVAIILFSAVGNIEEIFRAVGFRVTSGLDSTKLIAGGFATSMRSLGQVTTTAVTMMNGAKAIDQATGNYVSDAGRSALNWAGKQIDRGNSTYHGFINQISGGSGRVAQDASGFTSSLESMNKQALTSSGGVYQLSKNAVPITQDEELSAQGVIETNRSVIQAMEKGHEEFDPDGSLLNYNDLSAKETTATFIASGLSSDMSLTPGDVATVSGSCATCIPTGSTKIVRVAKLSDGSQMLVGGAYNASTGDIYLSGTSGKTDLRQVISVSDDQGRFVPVEMQKGLGEEVRGDVGADKFNDYAFAQFKLSDPESHFCSEDAIRAYQRSHMLIPEPEQEND